MLSQGGSAIQNFFAIYIRSHDKKLKYSFKVGKIFLRVMLPINSEKV